MHQWIGEGRDRNFRTVGEFVHEEEVSNNHCFFHGASWDLKRLKRVGADDGSSYQSPNKGVSVFFDAWLTAWFVAGYFI